MTRLGYTPYEPQLSPVVWAENVWTVEGPEVPYQLGGLVIPCPTRMTVVRLNDGMLWLHSPVIYSVDLHNALAEFGPISTLIAPNSYHYLNIRTWSEICWAAHVFASPDCAPMIGVARCESLGAYGSACWSRDLEHAQIDLGSFKETVFFHHASRTLIVTDLMQNFESSRVRNLPTKLLLKAGGATGPNGRPSIEIRLAARKHRAALQAGVQQMIAWRPARIILSHGRCFHDNAVAEIERAFASVL